MLDTGDLGPGLMIPLPPRSGVAAAFRDRVIGLCEPTFSSAHRGTTQWIAATVAVAFASQFVVAPALRWWAVAITATMAVYVAIRAVAVAVYEREQRQFEPAWLAEQSKLLQEHAFEVVRFTVWREWPVRSSRRTYDLTRPSDVDELLRRQVSEPTAQARVDFVHWSADVESDTLIHVVRDLRDFEVTPVRGTLIRPRIRFPHAWYASRPPEQKRDLGRPGLRTFWLLPSPLRLTVTASDAPISASPHADESSVAVTD